MSDTASLLGDLADACLNQANKLQAMQAALNYQGPQIAPLYANETALRTKVLVLNTASVSAALVASADAQAKLKDGTAAANQAVATIKEVAAALQVSADLISLAASALGGSPQGVITAATHLIGDVEKLSGGG